MIALAFLTGAAGLCVEILWARWLTIQAGRPLASFTIAVCGFMAGMAAGAAWAGSRGDRLAHPLRRFGWLQLAAALPVPLLVLLPVDEGVRRALIAAGLTPGSLAFVATLAMLGALPVFVPAAAMGTATPLLVVASVRRGTMPQPAYARIAAAQAAGGAAGALLCGSLLLPRYGLSRSVLAAGALSLLAGAIAVASRPADHAGRVRARPSPGAPRIPAAPVRTAAALLACGMALTAMEVVWTRLAFLTFGSTARAASLVLAAAVIGLASGSLLGPAIVRRLGGRGALAALAGFASVSLLLTAPALGRLPLAGAWVARMTGPGTEEPVTFLIVFLAAVLPCLCIGAAFPAGFASLRSAAATDQAEEARAAGTASVCSSLGTLAGAPAAWAALAAGMGSRGTLLASAALAGAGGLFVASRGRAVLLPLGGIVLAAGMSLGPGWDVGLLSSGPYLYGTLYGWAQAQGAGLAEALRARGPVLHAQEGTEALVTVRRGMSGTLSLQVNGKTDASTGGDMKTQVLVAQLPALLWKASAPPGPAPRGLVIGLGSGVSAGSLLTHGGDVTVIEISPEVAGAARWFDAASGGALDHPRMRLIVDDARTRLLFDPSRYDVIVSQPSNPWVAGQAILFTREYFQLARDRLAPGGVVCQWVQGYGLRAEDFRSVVATFASVFPHATLWEESTAGGDYLLVGTPEPLPINASALAGAMSPPAVHEDLRRVEVGSVQELLSHIVAGPAQVSRLAAGAGLQTQDRMALEFTARAALREETLGSILGVLEPHRPLPSSLVEADAGILADLERRARSGRQERRWAEGLGLFEVSGASDMELLRAVTYLRRGMRDHARESVLSVLARHPGDPLPRRLLAHLAMTQGRLGEAAEALVEAVRLAPRHVPTRLYLSRALFAAGRLPAALQVNADALALLPGSAEAASDRCALLLAAGEDASAEEFCRQAVALDPALAEAYANLGVLRARQGRADEAARAYERGISLDPGLRDARFNLAALCERQGLGGRGLSVLEPLLQEEGADAETLRLAARLALLDGDAARARAWLERSLSLEPGSAEASDTLRRLP